MKEQNKKKIFLMIVGVITLLLVVGGATFAYFAAQVGKGDTAQINAQAGTTDSLSFNISDIDVSDNQNKIVDESREDSIIINANQSNFGPNGNSIGDGVKLNAHLIAGDDDKDAHFEYYVYLQISTNNLEYTTPENTPELVLVVQDPTNEYIDEIKGLTKSEITLGEESVPCFDITKASGLITIASKYKIDATKETNGEADQNWQVRVIFKNLETDQHLNTDKSFTATLSIQSEKINYLDLASYANCDEDSDCEYTDYRKGDSWVGSMDDGHLEAGYNYQIKNVSFVDYIAEEDELNSIAKWDLSSSKDGSIMGWLKVNDDENVPYDLYIGSNLKEGEKIKVRSFAHAFEGLDWVETIDLNSSILDTSNLTDTSRMFSDCRSLTNITDLKNLDVSNVEDMSYMFYGVDDMTTLDISNWNTHNVINMSNMFGGSRDGNETFSSLENIIGIENLDVSNVKNMSGMFSYLSNLVTLNLSNWDTSKVTNMSNMFHYASSLTSIDMRKATFSQLTSYDNMFSRTNPELKVTITGDANKNWFIERAGTEYGKIGLTTEQLENLFIVLPE